MPTITEIEAAIERLPGQQVNELAEWLQKYRVRRTAVTRTDEWLANARGSAKPGVTTEDVMHLTRGDA